MFKRLHIDLLHSALNWTWFYTDQTGYNEFTVFNRSSWFSYKIKNTDVACFVFCCRYIYVYSTMLLVYMSYFFVHNLQVSEVFLVFRFACWKLSYSWLIPSCYLDKLRDFWSIKGIQLWIESRDENKKKRKRYELQMECASWKKLHSLIH